MATIEVNIVAKENLAAESVKAAAGMKILAAEETKVKALAKDIGVEEKAIVKTIGAQEKAEKALEAAKIKSLKLSKLELATEKAFKREYRDMADILRGDITPLLEGLGPKAGVAVAVTGALVAAFAAAAVGAGVLLGTVASLALTAGKARDETRAMLDVLTGGKGGEALEMLDGLARQLGESITETRAKFLEFRKAGLDNTQSTALIKLQADLKATGMSAADAKAGIEKVLAASRRADGSIDGKKFKEAFELIAAQANVAGNGFLAAEKNAASFAGAMNRLDNAKVVALEQIFDRIKPAIDEAASKVATFVEAFLASEEGKKAIESLSSAIVSLAKFGAEAIIFVVEHWKGFAVALGVVAAGAAVALAIFAPIPTAILAIVGAITYIVAKFTEFDNALGYLSDEARAWGQNIVEGISQGISNAAGALLAKVKNLASSISTAFRDVLGINSPAKDGIEVGKFEGKGIEVGLDKAKPGVEASAEDLGGAVSAGVTGGGVASPGGGSSSIGSGGDFNVTIQSLIFGAAEAQTDYASFRRMLDEWWSARQAARGVT